MPLRESPARSIPWFGMAIFLVFGFLGILFVLFFSTLIVQNKVTDPSEKRTLLEAAPWVVLGAGSVPLFAGVIGMIYGLIKRPSGFWWKALLLMFLTYAIAICFTIAAARFF